MALQISFNLTSVFDQGFLNYQLVTFSFIKCTTNFIKMHECYLLSAEFYMYALVGILVIMNVLQFAFLKNAQFIEF